MDQEPNEILDKLTAEQTERADTQIKFQIPLQLALAIVGCLQLSLRHPGVQGTHTGKSVREFVDQTISHFRDLGLDATANAAALGDNPAYDALIS